LLEHILSFQYHSVVGASFLVWLNLVIVKIVAVNKQLYKELDIIGK